MGQYANNKLIIAAAGAGKTTHIVSEALRHKSDRVIIITYTLANEAEIVRKLLQRNKCIPAHITIQTWFSFLLEHGARPYQGCLSERRIKGMILVNCQSGVKYCIKGKPVCFCESTEFDNHYFSSDSQMYSDKISKFVVRCNDLSGGNVIDRISRMYDHIYIDEVQDLAGYDLDVLKLLFECKSQILMAGDPRQVTYLTHHEAKHRQYQKGRIKDFILEKCGEHVCEIDDTTLNVSHRCCEAICSFASRLYPHLPKCRSNQRNVTGHDGVFLVRSNDYRAYLTKYKPVQLYYQKAEYPGLNFGESKGMTFDRVLIHPTKSVCKYLADGKLTETVKNRRTKKLEEKEAFDIAKFYVALTRARYSVGILYDYNSTGDIPGTVRYSPSSESIQLSLFNKRRKTGISKGRVA